MGELLHLPDASEARSWVGYRLDGTSGTGLGRVETLLVDAETGDPAWFAVRFGRFSGRSAVPVEASAGAGGHVWVPYDKKLLRSAASIDSGEALTCGLERKLATHFGLPDSSPRLQAIAERADDAAGSVPA